MIKVLVSSEFQRAFKKLKRHPELKARTERVLRQLAADPFHSSLKSHPLGGEHDGYHSCSVAYDLRIVFRLGRNKRTHEQELVLVNIGTHDDVY